VASASVQYGLSAYCTLRAIPRFDAENGLHADLAASGAEAEKVAAKVALPLAESGVAERIDALVARLLP